jgi:ketosteroid isomerase-like protein
MQGAKIHGRSPVTTGTRDTQIRMSEENVALVQSAYAAFNLGDFDAAMELLDPEIEWQLPPNIPDTGTLHGLPEVRVGLGGFLESWESFRADVKEVIEAGDRVVVLVRFSGQSNVGMQLEGAGVDGHLWTIRDGRAIRVQMFSGTDDALDAVGIRR